MTAPAIVAGHTTSTEPGNTTNHDIATPTHANGDVIYILAAIDSGGTSMTPPAGFAAVHANFSDVAIASVARFSIWKKTASGEGGSYIWTSGAAERSVTVAFAVNGDVGINAVGTNATGTGTIATIPAVTTTLVDTLRISAVFTDGVSTPHSTPSGYTELAELSETSGASLSIQYKVLSGSGTSASEVVGLTSEEWVGITFAIESSAGSQTITPAAASAVGGATNPTVILSGVIHSPLPASAVGGAAGPTIVLSSMTIAPAVASAVGGATNPTVILGGGTTVTPAAASAVGGATDPVVTIGGAANNNRPWFSVVIG